MRHLVWIRHPKPSVCPFSTFTTSCFQVLRVLFPSGRAADILQLSSYRRLVFVKQQQFDLFKFALPGQPLPPEMTLAQLLTLLYDRKQPQGYQSINLTVKLGSKVISDPGLSKTDSFKRLRTEKGTQTWSSTVLLAFRCGV